MSLLLFLSLSACTLTPDAPVDICAAASERLATCMGVVVPDDTTGCDEVGAQEILDTDCEFLASAREHEDVFGDAYDWGLCLFGWLSHCEVPTCETTVAEESACSDYLELDSCGACDYYDCREAESAAQCGAEGYYEAFGAKNCRTLTQVTGPELSANGQRWLAATRQCLLEYVEDEIALDASCDTIMDQAMDSHVDCYVDSGFCEMSIFDKRILGKSISIKDLDVGTIAKTEVKCVAKRLRGRN